MNRKDWNFYDQILASCVYFRLNVENFHRHFFSILILLFSKTFCTLLFHSAVAFQQYQIYYFFKKCLKVIVVLKISAMKIVL